MAPNASSFLYTADELDEARSVLDELIAETSFDTAPRRATILLRMQKIIDGYDIMLRALRAIHTMPGRQMAGLPWLATLEAILQGSLLWVTSYA